MCYFGPTKVNGGGGNGDKGTHHEVGPWTEVLRGWVRGWGNSFPPPVEAEYTFAVRLD